MKASDSTDRPAKGMNRRRFHTTLAAAALTAAFARRVLGANDRINVGVIGCGGRAGAHINALLNLKDQGEKVEIVGVCDTYRGRLDKAAEKTGAKATMAHEELLARDDVDLVCIATPDHAHGYQTIDALRAGKDVYVEKPLAHWRQLGLPEQIVKVSNETGQLVQVGCQWMSNPAYSAAKDIIKAGGIGNPITAETGYYRVGDWGEAGMPIDDPNVKPGPDLDWERFLGDSPRVPFDVSRYFRWRMYWDYAGGPATDLYPHPFTPVAYMLDLGYPDKVMCNGGMHRYTEREVPDTCNMLIEYPQKLTVILTGTQGNNHGSYGSGLRPIIRGWDATLTFDESDILIRPTQGSSKKEERIQVDFGEKFHDFWSTFLQCCRERKQPQSNAAIGAVVQTTMQMGIASLRGERVVRFDHDRGRVIG